MKSLHLVRIGGRWINPAAIVELCTDQDSPWTRVYLSDGRSFCVHAKVDVLVVYLEDSNRYFKEYALDGSLVPKGWDEMLNEVE